MFYELMVLTIATTLLVLAEVVALAVVAVLNVSGCGVRVVGGKLKEGLTRAAQGGL